MALEVPQWRSAYL